LFKNKKGGRCLLGKKEGKQGEKKEFVLERGKGIGGVLELHG